MPESVRQDLPARADDHIAFRISADQLRVLRQAAELIGWTVTDYILSTALDRAERDIHTHAAESPRPSPPPPDPAVYTALLLADL